MNQICLVTAWCLIRLVSHLDDFSQGWSLIRVDFHQGGLIMLSFHQDISLGWSFIRVVSDQGGFSLGWSHVDFSTGWSH